MNNIYLKVPNISELSYRQKWLMNEYTMSYNAGLDIDLDGYDKKTGTIKRSNEEMILWYNNWINHEPDKYYAYIYEKEINEPIGEIYYYKENDSHSLGILINSEYRGKGYSYYALMELLKIAFEKNNVDKIVDEFEENRTSAINLFLKAGFMVSSKDRTQKIFDEDFIIKQVYITKEMYFKSK